MRSLQHALERARAAVRSRAGAAVPHQGDGGVEHLDGHDFNRFYEHHIQETSDNSVAEAHTGPLLTPSPILDMSPGAGRLPGRQPDVSTIRPTAPATPRVRVSVSPPALPAPSRPAYRLDELVAGVELNAGPRRLLALLGQLACDLVQARAYRVMPSQVTLHQPQELVAAALGVHRVTVWRWTRTLEALGVVAAREHYTGTAEGTRVDGMLYAVAMTPGHRAHLTIDDLAHSWRDLDADRRAGRTAWKVLQRSETQTETDWYLTLKAWAVTPGETLPPVDVDRCSLDGDGPRTVQDVVYALPLLVEAHVTKRPALIGMLGAALAHSIDGSTQWRRLWCRRLWEAHRAEGEGRGGLQVLAAQLARLEADRREGAPWRNPGAVLAARLRAA